jgi:SOS-response transcriptional repressor LexA
MATEKAIRPTKKQRELLTFIEVFIGEHGYSPSYREVMSGLGYTSVASVALHINSLIKRGHLRKRDRSARSLEVVKVKSSSSESLIGPVSEGQEKWLAIQIDFYFQTAEKSKALSQRQLDELYVLVGALRVLGLEGAAQSFLPRLAELKNRLIK